MRCAPRSIRSTPVQPMDAPSLFRSGILKWYRVASVKSSVAQTNCCDPSPSCTTRDLFLTVPSSSLFQRRLPKLSDVRQGHIAPPRRKTCQMHVLSVTLVVLGASHPPILLWAATCAVSSSSEQLLALLVLMNLARHGHGSSRGWFRRCACHPWTSQLQVSQARVVVMDATEDLVQHCLVSRGQQ